MPSTLLDSAVFRDIFTTPAMRNVFSDENRVQKYLDFEKALAVAQAKLKIIPQNACDEIVQHWVNYFVYHRSIVPKAITKKL